jgi:hypothetical protein
MFIASNLNSAMASGCSDSLNRFSVRLLPEPFFLFCRTTPCATSLLQIIRDGSGYQPGIDGVMGKFCVVGFHAHLLQNAGAVCTDCFGAQGEEVGNLADGFPEAIKRITSNSRSESDPCSGPSTPPRFRSTMSSSGKSWTNILPTFDHFIYSL